MKKSLLLLLAFVSLFAACKKSEKEEQDKIIGKWTLDRNVYNEYVDGTLEREEEGYDAGDYFEFREDGTCTIRAYSEVESGMYSVQDNAKLLFTSSDAATPGTDTLDIKTLTDSDLTLYTKETDGADYAELYLYLSR